MVEQRSRPNSGKLHRRFAGRPDHGPALAGLLLCELVLLGWDGRFLLSETDTRVDGVTVGK